MIDDESDYFSVDSNQVSKNIGSSVKDLKELIPISFKWLSPSQRLSLAKRKEELAQQKHASRLDKKYIFDFAGNFLSFFNAMYPKMFSEKC